MAVKLNPETVVARVGNVPLLRPRKMVRLSVATKGSKQGIVQANLTARMAR
jgi:hypothetical protein